MAPKRRDNKGRIIQIGEWQEPNGRYRYMYNDALGKRKIVYSWRLTEADPVPAHKHKDVPLREKEKQVMSLFMQGISGSDMTVVELVERYTSLKSGVKQSTHANYKTVINNLKKTEYAYRHVDQVKLSYAKMFLISLQRNGLGYSSIHNIRGVLRPAFQMAVDDDMILIIVSIMMASYFPLTRKESLWWHFIGRNTCSTPERSIIVNMHSNYHLSHHTCAGIPSVAIWREKESILRHYSILWDTLILQLL